MNYSVYTSHLLQCSDLYTHEYYVLSYHKATDNTVNCLIPSFVLPYKFDYNKESLNALHTNIVSEYIVAMETTFDYVNNIYAALLHHRNADSYSRTLFRIVREVQQVTSACYSYIDEEFLPVLRDFISSKNCITKLLVKSLVPMQVLLRQFRRYISRLFEFLHYMATKAEVGILKEEINLLTDAITRLSSKFDRFWQEVKTAYEELTSAVKLILN